MDSEQHSEDSSVKSPVSSPPSTDEASPNYISSYTQISQFNNDNLTIGDHTDIESSDDEFNQNDEQSESNKNAIPELSSQIIEWSKKTINESVNELINESMNDEQHEQNEQLIKLANDEELKFFQLKFINDIEKQTTIIADNLNQMMMYLNSYASDVTNTSVNVMEIFRHNLFDTCDHIDADIKLMYKIIAKCEELNKSFEFLDDIRVRIKDIKQTLDQFERIIM